MKALHLMQEHHNNRYFSFHCISHEEQLRWYAEAEKLIPPLDNPSPTLVDNIP